MCRLGSTRGPTRSTRGEFASDEMKGELNKIIDSLYEQIVDGISYHRNISKNDVTDMINGVFVNGTTARIASWWIIWWMKMGCGNW